MTTTIRRIGKALPPTSASYTACRRIPARLGTDRQQQTLHGDHDAQRSPALSARRRWRSRSRHGSGHAADPPGSIGVRACRLRRACRRPRSPAGSAGRDRQLTRNSRMPASAEGHGTISRRPICSSGSGESISIIDPRSRLTMPADAEQPVARHLHLEDQQRKAEQDQQNAGVADGQDLKREERQQQAHASGDTRAARLPGSTARSSARACRASAASRRSAGARSR